MENPEIKGVNKRDLLGRVLNRLSLHTLLTVPFIILTVITVISISVLSTRSGYKAAAIITENLLSEIAYRAESKVRHLMNLPPLINRMNVDAYLSGNLNIENKKLRERYFYSLMNHFPDVPYVFIGTPKGSFYGAARRKDSLEIEHVRRDDTTNGESRYFTVNKDGTSGSMTKAFPGFDPRMRPWYKAAESLGKPVWSPVYKHFVVPSLAVTASHPMYTAEGKLIGIFAVDILLSRLNDFLRDLEIGKSGWAFVIEPSGALVASSTSDALFYKDKDTYKRINAKESTNLRIQKIAHEFLSMPKETNYPNYIDIEDKRYFTKFLNFSDDLGLNWTITIVIPESDFMEPLNQSITENIFICVIALLSFFIISFFISKTVTHPIEELNLAAKELAKGNWDYRINIKRSDEIGELSQSFQTMASQLKRSLSNLENLVEIRTRDLKESNQSLEREIKERIKTEEALLEAKKAAEEANRAKSDFIATLSHEIRTPMNGVIGLSSLLLESNLTEEQKENVSTIIASGDALLGIINQVLELSKIEAGVLETAKEPFNLEELCKQIVELLKAQAKRKGLYIEMTYSDSLPHCFIGDEGKIRQALMNLVGNAIKFTEKGGITIAISGLKDKEDLYRVKISVKDTGYGIAQDKQALLFKRFSRIIDKTTSRSGGTGLGLSIAKRLIELMGGDIGMSSQLGEGSTFWFELSLQDCTEKWTSIDNPSQHRYNRRFDDVKVLIVDDNPINQKVAAGMLKRFGCESTVASNGIEAVQKIQENQYDLILMDCVMPEMDGFEATERIRQIVKGRLPIVALTANATEEDKQRCLSAGMDGFITKPIRAKDVYEILDRWT